MTKQITILAVLLSTVYALSAQLSFSKTSPEEALPKLAFQSPSPVNMEEIQAVIEYPNQEQETGLEGLVICKVLVDKKGAYMRHKIVQSPSSAFSKAVDPHLARLRFVPALKNGTPVAVWTTIKFAFSLKDEAPKRIIDSDDQVQAFVHAAEALLAAGNAAKAFDVLEEALVLAKEEEAGAIQRSMVQAALQAGQYADARVLLTNLINDEAALSEKARLLSARAITALLQDKTALALQDLERIQQISTENLPDMEKLQSWLKLSELQQNYAVQELEAMSAKTSLKGYFAQEIKAKR
ncbi:MAG: energy transducer TonB [Bacteroidia bacterium]